MDKNWGQELGTGTGDRNREQEQVREQEQGVLEIVERVGEEGRESFERKRLSAGSALRAEF